LFLEHRTVLDDDSAASFAFALFACADWKWWFEIAAVSA